MKLSVLALAAVLTFGSTGIGLSGMAAERAAAADRGALAAAPRATPGPSDQLWYGGTLPEITVRAQAYSAVVMNPVTERLVLPHRRA